MSVNKSLAVQITADSSSYNAALNQAVSTTDSAAKRMQTSLQRIGGGNSQASMQNLGYQINDVAAQVASGGNVIQAVGMQVGQFLQAFGIWGSVIGAAIAVGGMFASSLWDSKDAAEAAKKAQEDYGDAVEFARKITETSEESSRRAMETERQKTIGVLRAAIAVDKLSMSELELRRVRRANELETAKAASQFQLVGPESEKNELADAVKKSNDALNVEQEKQEKTLRDKIAADEKLLNEALNPKSGWENDFKPTKGKKADRDALEDYMTSLRQSVELQKMDERSRAAREAVIRAENAAQSEQKKLTDGQIATVRQLALERYDLEQSQKPQKDDAVAAYIQDLQDSAAAMEVEGRARAVRAAMIEAQNIAMREGTILTAEQTAAVERLAGASYDLALAQKEAQEAQRKSEQEAAEATREHERAVKQLGMSFSSAFEEAITGGKAYGEVLKSLIADMAKLALRQTVTSPLSDLLSRGIGVAGDVATNWVHGMTNASMTPAIRGNYGTVGGVAINGARAAGGPVNANSAYLVGENGPEVLQLGNAPGYVVPNHKLGGMGGGNTTVVNQTIQVSTGVAATVRAELANAMPMIANATKAAISNDQARKGRSL